MVFEKKGKNMVTDNKVTRRFSTGSFYCIQLGMNGKVSVANWLSEFKGKFITCVFDMWENNLC